MIAAKGIGAASFFCDVLALQKKDRADSPTLAQLNVVFYDKPMR